MIEDTWRFSFDMIIKSNLIPMVESRVELDLSKIGVSVLDTIEIGHVHSKTMRY